MEVAAKSCEADIQRYCLLVCGRIIGGQKRELSELDRACLEQVIGFKIASVDFTTIAAELRSRSAADLDATLPELLRRKLSTDARIYDPCDSIIRHIETVAKSTAEVYGDKRRKRAAMAERIGLQLRWLVDTEREQDGRQPRSQNADAADNKVTSANEQQNVETLDHVKAELMGLIGLEAVKKDFLSISNLLRIRQLRKQHELNTQSLSLHLVFTGNPGTGKTTVARLLARAYRALSVLAKGHLVEVDRSGLVAGYTDRMTAFLESNPGLKSRFNKFIHFGDYTSDEMALIFEYMLDKAQYRASEEACKAINLAMASLHGNRDEHFGNGRVVRNLFEHVQQEHANRLASVTEPTREELLTNRGV